MLFKLTRFLIILFILVQGPIAAANNASATATYTVGSIDSISLSGNPQPLNILSAVAGSPLEDAVDSSTTYAITTNNVGRKIYAALATQMPAGVTLLVNLTAPSAATSIGDVSLSTTSEVVVSNISNVAQSGLVITYTLKASLTAAQVSGATNTITYTIGP